MSVQDVTKPTTAPPPLAVERVTLFLDLDGTLAHIVDRPDAVGPEPRRNALLARLADRLEGRIAILSGRTFADIDRILENAVPAAAGVHGLERRHPGGELERTPPHPALDEARAALETFAARDPGLLVEPKGASVALHYRLAPHEAAAAASLADQTARRLGLALQPGHAVVELRTPGPDKGESLKAFMARPPFDAGLPVFVGDDATDEPAFAAAAALGGYGVQVGPARETAARHRLADVDAVLDWLEAAS